MGITNELFPNERGFGGVPPPAACLGNLLPEDETNFVPIGPTSDTSNVPSDIEDFAIFMRFLNDGITQGAAGPDQFRTAPLWGIGQRLFFLHDGRTSDLLVAIKAHASRGSEANAVIRNYNGLSPTQQQEVLDFLRSL